VTGSTIKVAAVQMEPILGDKEGNINKLLASIDEAASTGAKLIVTPECAVSAYVLVNRNETAEVAETIPGYTTDVFSAKAKENNVYIVLGMIEVDGTDFYNVAVLIGPEGIIGKYRKMHPFYLIEERWPVTPGSTSQDYPVFDTPIGKIGIAICFDIWVPEAPRLLALNGADIIAFPTNSDNSTEGSAGFEHVVQTRALESRVWIVGANRIGVERKVTFSGRSQIVGLSGEVLVEASTDQEEIVYADIQPRAARDKRGIPGLASSDLWGNRRPDSYTKISSGDFQK
jgi:predicted amidohydrolase